MYTKLRRNTSIHGTSINTFGFHKHGRHIGFLLQVSILTVRHLDAILHLYTKFCPNRTTAGQVMTSYFLKMAAVCYFEYGIKCD